MSGGDIIEKNWQKVTVIVSVASSAVGFVAWLTATYSELRHARIDVQNQMDKLLIEVKDLNQHQVEMLNLINRNSTDIAVLKAKSDGK